MRCRSPEQTTGDGHNERGGDTLSRHVADDEVELLILDEEVVEVAPHLLGRYKTSSQCEVVTLGKGREYLGNHPHLYALRDAQLALDAFPIGRGRLELVDVLHQRVLQIFERVVQFLEFIPGAYLWQLGRKVSMGYLLGHVGELLDGGYHLADAVVAEGNHEQQGDEAQDNEYAAQQHDIGIEFTAGTHYGYCPLSGLYGGVEDEILVATHIAQHLAGHTAQDVALHLPQRLTGVAIGRGEDGLVEDEFSVGMHDV